MNEQEFEVLVGRPPIQDDMDRVNCTLVGRGGHLHCGVCDEHKLPRFICGCLAKLDEPKET